MWTTLKSEYMLQIKSTTQTNNQKNVIQLSTRRHCQAMSLWKKWPGKPPLGLGCWPRLLMRNSAQFFSTPKSSRFQLRRCLVVKTCKKQKNNPTCSHIKGIWSRQGCTLATYFGEDLHNQSAPRRPRVGWVVGGEVTTCRSSWSFVKKNRICPIPPPHHHTPPITPPIAT